MNVDRLSERRVDWMLLCLSLLAVAAATSGILRFGPTILFVAGLPILGFLVLGHVPSRGAAVGVMVLILGALGLRMGNPNQTAGMGQLVLLSSMTVATMVAGVMVDREATTSYEPSNLGRRWMSIEVQTELPPEVGGELVRPKVAPSSGPERRGLTRLRGPKSKRWKVRPIGTMSNES